MKAERRHELHHNALADWLAGVIEQAKPHAGVIAGVIAAAVLAIAAIAYFSGSGDARRGPVWAAYFRAAETDGFDQRVKELQRVADEHPGTPVALWAKLKAGEARLLEGTNLYYKDRLAGEEQLSKASDLFQTVAEGAAKLPPLQGEELRRQALWNLAQTHEVLAEVEDAIAKYEEVAKQWPDAAFGKAAATRAKKLSGMADWLKWYTSIDPKSIKPSSQDRQPPLDFSSPRQPQSPPPDTSLDLDPTTSGGLLLDPPSGSTDKPASEPSGDAEPSDLTPPAEARPPAAETKPAAEEDAASEGGN